MLPTLAEVTAGVWPLSDVIVRRRRARCYAPAMVDERLALDRRRCDRARVARDARYDIGHSALLFIATVAAFAVVALAAWAQAPLDPQSLIGVWSGTLINKNIRGYNGQYQLTIEQVKGDKVNGQVVISGRETAQFKIGGTLNGNRLTFGKQNPTELLIEGNQTKGASQEPLAPILT